MRIDNIFSEYQLQWLKDNGFDIIGRDFTDDEFVDLIDRLEYLLCSKGLSEDDLNDLGIVCDEILHILVSKT